MKSRRDTVTMMFVTEKDFANAIFRQENNKLLTKIVRCLGKDDAHEHSEWKLEQRVLRTRNMNLRQEHNQVCAYQRDMILTDWNNGLSKEERDRLSDPHVSQWKRRKIVQGRRETVTFKFAPEKEYTKALLQIQKSKQSRPLARFASFMSHYFKTPLGWKELRRQPLSMFGGAFSHQESLHLIGNTEVFKAFAPIAMNKLGASRFTHLYLFCVLTSTAASCVWNECAPVYFLNENTSHSLGASGAISGVLAFAMCHLVKVSGLQGNICIANMWVRPHVALLSYVLADVAGLLRSEHLMKIVELILNKCDVEQVCRAILESLSSNGGAVDGAEDETPKNIGYAAHLGGYVGGGSCFMFIIQSVPRIGEVLL